MVVEMVMVLVKGRWADGGGGEGWMKAKRESINNRENHPRD